jgi:hypothetical protein
MRQRKESQMKIKTNIKAGIVSPRDAIVSPRDPQ